MAPPQDKNYCFFIARDISSALMTSIYLLAIIFIVHCIWKQIKRMRRQASNILTVVQAMYMFLLLWCLFDIVEVITSLWLYFSEIFTHEHNKNQQFVKTREQVSMFLLLFTFSSIFLQHTALILAPYHWHKIVVTFFEEQVKKQLKNKTTNSTQKIKQVNHQIKALNRSWDSRINKTIKLFIPIRQIGILVWFISTLMLITEVYYGPKQKLSYVSYSLVALDSFLILLLFSFGRRSIHKNKPLLQKLQEEEVSRMKKMYNIWIFAISFRLLFFFARMLLPLQDQGVSFSNCECSKSFTLFPFLYLAVQILLVDLALAAVILRMYWISVDDPIFKTESSQNGKTLLSQ